MNAKVVLLLVLVSSASAQSSRERLHERISAVCPIDGVSIGAVADKTTWRPQYRPEATLAQRAAAQAIIAGWTEADWEGTAPQRRRNRLESILLLHARRAALTIERDYWQGQGDAARVAAINALLQQAQDQIDALRPQS